MAPKVRAQLELLRPHVDRDDALGAGDGRALDRVEPDAAGAEHRDRAARRDPRGVEHGADARHHRAAEERALSRGASAGSLIDARAGTTASSAMVPTAE